MMKRLGIPALALASVLAMAAPNLTLAAERGNQRGGGNEVARQDFRGGNNEARGNQNFDRGRQDFNRGGQNFDRDDRHFDRDDRGGNWGVGVYTAPAPVIAPAPAAAGYYDQFGVWHPYGYYDQFGVWHSY